MPSVRDMSERRRTPRADVALDCTLSRRAGSAIAARTVNLGPGGMRVTAKRPLALDEVLRFELPFADAEPLGGNARVLRQEGVSAYALRFEGLHEPAQERLRQIAGV